jgi:regulator of RNase E activity RraA
VLTRGGDNLAILRAFEFCRPGDVMVIDAGGDITNAVIGGILSFYAATIGLAGMVIDGAIRDVAEIRSGWPARIRARCGSSLIANAETQRAREEATMQAMRDGRWDRSFIDALEARCAN